MVPADAHLLGVFCIMGADDDERPGVAPARLPSLRTASFVAFSILCSWLLGHFLMIRPAQYALAQAQQTLLQSEREELAAENAASRERRRVHRLRSKLETVTSDAKRMRDAEASAHAQLNLLNAVSAERFCPAGTRCSERPRVGQLARRLARACCPQDKRSLLLK